jgi:hypothetical protein
MTDRSILTRREAIQQEAEEKLAKVTPGEWCAAYDEVDERGVVDAVEHAHTVAHVFSGQSVRVNEMGRLPGMRRRNAEFIAAAPRLVRDLLALSLAQQEQIEELEAVNEITSIGVVLTSTEGTPS